MFLGAMKRYSYTNICIQILANNTIHAANKEQFDNTFKQTRPANTAGGIWNCQPDGVMLSAQGYSLSSSKTQLPP